MHEILSSIESAAVALGPSPWLVVAVLVLSCVDGFFPPVPSESVVIAAAVLAVAGDMPASYLLLLVLAAAVGAFFGDLIAYCIGSRVPVDRLRMLRGPRGRAALSGARSALAAHGGSIILTGRFIPVGRVAVNMTLGAVCFGFTRFMPLACLASVLWAVSSAAMGVGAGHLFRDSPLLAMALGIVAGALIGLILDRLIRTGEKRFSFQRRRWPQRRAVCSNT